jgi:hypothetical protein
MALSNATEHRSADTAANAPALLANPAGDYRVLPGGAAYCTGIVPDDGFEVVRVQLDPWLPLDEGYDFIERYLMGVGRPVQAFCGIEMRLPAPLSRGRWSEFNDPYLARLRGWGLTYGDLAGVCRSNIALAVDPPEQASVCAFSYVRPAAAPGAATFCLSGTADIDPQGNAIADGDTSPAAMQERTRYTIEVIGQSLAQLGLAWRDANQWPSSTCTTFPTCGDRRCSEPPATRSATACSSTARGRPSPAARSSSRRAERERTSSPRPAIGERPVRTETGPTGPSGRRRRPGEVVIEWQSAGSTRT